MARVVVVGRRFSKGHEKQGIPEIIELGTTALILTSVYRKPELPSVALRLCASAFDPVSTPDPLCLYA